MPPSSSRSEKIRPSSPTLPRKKTVACRPCNARKIRCSGTKPCNNCTRTSDCIYPSRDRQVRVHQSFLDRILQENADLRSLHNHTEQSQNRTREGSWSPSAMSQDVRDSADDQPILEKNDWFTNVRMSDTPIWIGEISDAAFATRFRQFASFSQAPSHITRTQFASDDTLRVLATACPAWPSLSRARLLAETAHQFLQHSYHIVRRSEVFQILRTENLDQPNSSTQRAKMWALFAIGELRSSKCLPAAGHYPGLAYFAIASDAIRMVNERPQVEVIETVLLLALYSLEINRRHTAGIFVGIAVRLATTMGLNVSIGPTFVPNPELREHRIRLWWSVYIIDRFLSSKIGLPLLISDADISVHLPSDNAGFNSEDFGHHHHQFVATVRLAKIAGHISRSLYVRTPQRGTFLQRVDMVREQLNQWQEQLPNHLRLDLDGSHGGDRQPQSAILLHLSFNQLFIVATRPVLLFIFRHHIDEKTIASSDPALPAHTVDVADACIHAARQSCGVLTKCWVNGDFHIFDYFYVQHLFSAAVILAIAGHLGRESSRDENDEFNLAAGFLQQLAQGGNFAAMEFYSHIQEIQSTLNMLPSDNVLHTALPRSEDLRTESSNSHPWSCEKAPTVPSASNAGSDAHTVDDVPLDLSFIDDWIYEDALEKLSW